MAADLVTKLILPVPTGGCKYYSLLKMSVIIMYKSIHVFPQLAPEIVSYIHALLLVRILYA